MLIVFIAGWLYIRYDNRDFLRYGVLRIDKFPESLKILSNETAGWTDQEYGYYISIDPVEFNKLLGGRIYVKQIGLEKAIPSVPDSFPANTCYTSGELKNGLITIFVNNVKSEAYIFYDID